MAEYSASIFVVRQRGRAAGMLAAFQGSDALPDGKKTGEELPILPLVSITHRTEKMVNPKQRAPYSSFTLALISDFVSKPPECLIN